MTLAAWFFAIIFVKLGQSRPLFVYFCSFLVKISIIQIEKSIDGVLGIRTWGRTMVGTKEIMELWRPPRFFAIITLRPCRSSIGLTGYDDKVDCA